MDNGTAPSAASAYARVLQANDEESAVLHDAETTAFAPLGSSLYEYKARPYRDIWASVAYLLWLTVAVISSFVSFGVSNSDALKGKYSNDFYRNSTTCDVSTFVAPGRSSTEGSATFGVSFAVSISIWLPVSLAIGLALAIGYLWVFRNHAVKAVYAAFIGSSALCLAMAIVMFAAGAVGGGVLLLIAGLAYAAIVWFNRQHLVLVGQLLQVAGNGLKACPGIITVAICIKVAGTALMVLLFMGIVCASFTGQVVPNTSRTMVIPTSASGSGYCVGVVAIAQGSAVLGTVDCCTFQTSGWAAAQMLISIIALSWTAQVLLQLKLYVVADTIAQWYFMPPGTSDPYLRPSARRAVRHGLTSSFGSVCFSSLILAVIEMLRSAMNNAQNNSDGCVKVICCILNCIAQCILDVLEMFTRFATIACAITGKAFVPAAKDLYGTLKRNFLATFSLWWMPDFVLGMSCLLITLAWSGIVYAATYLQWKGELGGTAVGLGVLVAFCGALALGFILYFTASLMLDSVNSIYICFSLDRDRKIVTHPEVHSVYLALPTLQHAVIEQPGGEMAYGSAPNAPPMQQQAGGYSSVAMTPQPTYGGSPMHQVPPQGYPGAPVYAPYASYASMPYPAAQYPAAIPAPHLEGGQQPPPYAGYAAYPGYQQHPAV